MAAKGDPLDGFELYNASTEAVDLSVFMFADDLADEAQRVSFDPGEMLAPGAYLRIDLDKNGWPGFALGSDEGLGV